MAEDLLGKGQKMNVKPGTALVRGVAFARGYDLLRVGVTLHANSKVGSL